MVEILSIEALLNKKTGYTQLSAAIQMDKQEYV